MGEEDKMCEGENAGLYIKGSDRYENIERPIPIRGRENMYLIIETEKNKKRITLLDNKEIIKEIKWKIKK